MQPYLGPFRAILGPKQGFFLSYFCAQISVMDHSGAHYQLHIFLHMPCGPQKHGEAKCVVTVFFTSEGDKTRGLGGY